MKFDVLIEQYLNEEANMGSRGGHMSKEESLATLDTENDINNFLKTSHPKYLIRTIMVALDHSDKKIKFGKEYLSGESFIKKVKDVFFKESSPNYINIPRNENGEILNQTSFFNTLKKAKGTPKELEYKYIFKTAGYYGTWGQLCSLIYTRLDFQSSDRRQSTTSESISVKYKNALGNEHDYIFHVDTTDNTITGDPFSSPTDWRKLWVRPFTFKDDDSFDNFKNALKERGNTLDDLLELINGTVGRSKTKTKTKSTKQKMQEFMAKGGTMPQFLELMRQGKA